MAPDARPSEEAIPPTGPIFKDLPAFLAWRKCGIQFALDPIYHKEDLDLVQFDSVDQNAQFLVLDSEDILPITRGWGICLLGRFAGRFPGKEAIQGLMKRWPCKSRVTIHRRGWLCFQFGSEGDMEKVRQKGPFDVFGTPLVLQPMPSDFDPDMEPEVKVPVWLRLVDLPLDLWNLSAVSKIASFIGTPLTTDFKTLRRESMDGPRIQVIVNTAQRPKEAISVQLPSGNFLEVKIEYEFMPKYCPSCKVYGHLLEECTGQGDEWELVKKKETHSRSASRGRSKSAPRKPNSSATPYRKKPNEQHQGVNR